MASIRKRAWTGADGQRRTAWRVDFTDANGQRGQKQFSTKREADAFRVETEGKLRAGTFRPDAGKISVAELCNAYLVYAEGRMMREERFTRHHLSVVRGHIRNHLLHPKHGIGLLRLEQLTARSLGDLRDDLRGDGLSVPTTRKVLSTLHSILEFARVDRDLIAVNVAKGVRVIGRRADASKKIIPPDKADMRRLMEQAAPDFRIKLMVASFTGIRAGELHALRWRHISFDKEEMSVETRVDAYGEEDVTKTAAGMRTIPLSRPLLIALKEWRMRSVHSKADDLVFPNRRGKYTCHDNMVKRQFHPLFAATGVTSFNWHALRHFAISTWIEAGLSPKTVQVFAGHSSLQVTMDRYGHLFKSDDHRHAMNQIASELS